MVLDELPVPRHPTNLNNSRARPTTLAVGAVGGCLDIISRLSFLLLSSSPWETAQYRLNYCLKGPLNLKQPAKQPFFLCILSYTAEPMCVFQFS